jgi:hypothetical protein
LTRRRGAHTAIRVSLSGLWLAGVGVTPQPVANVMGSLPGSVKLKGWLARVFYVSLYRMHQVALYGVLCTRLRVAGDRVGRSAEPGLKLH